MTYTPLNALHDARQHGGRFLAPWRDDENVILTNGHMMIITPADGMDPIGTWHPICRITDTKPKRPKFMILDMSDVVLPAPEECEVCEGSGEIFEDCGYHKSECAMCEGFGKSVQKRFVRIGGTQFDAEYIRIIFSLPGAKISAPQQEELPAYFVFDGGKGYVMPCRWIDEAALIDVPAFEEQFS